MSMDTKEVLLLLGLIIEVLKDLVTWVQGLSGQSDVPSVSGVVAGFASWFVAPFRG